MFGVMYHSQSGTNRHPDGCWLAREGRPAVWSKNVKDRQVFDTEAQAWQEAGRRVGLLAQSLTVERVSPD